MEAITLPLNKGRGINPGDTRPAINTAPPIEYRSTKAGGLTPATPAALRSSPIPVLPLNKGRGINPGDTFGKYAEPDPLTVAQQRPGD